MSKYVDEIIHDLKTNPDNWNRSWGYGVRKGKIDINRANNGALLSLIEVSIGSDRPILTYWDRFKLERAVKKWYKRISLAILTR